MSALALSALLSFFLSLSFSIGFRIGLVDSIIGAKMDGISIFTYISNIGRGFFKIFFYKEQSFQFNHSSRQKFLSTLIYPCLLSPFDEELFFRGFLQPSMEWLGKKWLPSIKVGLPIRCSPVLPISTVVAILATSIFFGIYHLSNKNFSHKYKQSLKAGFSGVIHGYLKFRYGIFSSIIAHAINNTTLTIAYYGKQSQTERS